jgi:uncharacterized protein (DUF2164 family)
VDTLLLMLLFLGFLAVSMLMILGEGLWTVHKERQAEEDEAAAIEDALRAGPHFFATEPADDRERRSAEDPVVANVERYLRREQALAARFVSQPTVRNLYHHSERAKGVADIERYLKKEQELAADFVSEPSVDALLRRTERTL